MNVHLWIKDADLRFFPDIYLMVSSNLLNQMILLFFQL